MIIPKEVFKRHGKPVSIICDRDLRFPHQISGGHFRRLGTNLRYEYCVPSQNRRASERTIQTSRGFAACALPIDFGKGLAEVAIPIVKVRLELQEKRSEFTWEREDQFKKKYPHLFTKNVPSSSAAL
ncbi:hypothetical protein Tco_0990239 [Tanacetum coccineum]|uniref:Uncharacterized protein n=1 Tax=Tanacetum coccineum TaxID=301880 RepID=A0ABQ5EX23_9ASTR